MTPSKSSHPRHDRIASGADQVAPALYVNYFEVGHNPFEFLVDLGQYHPGSGEGDGCFAIHTRIAIAPPFAKMLSELLARAVDEHESQNGQIAPIGTQTHPFDIVLSSLGDFEDRARALRARREDSGFTAGAHRPSTVDEAARPARPRKGR